MNNPYETLNINKAASKDEIRKAYRDKAMNDHPDRGGDKNKFSEISIAYSILNDSFKRKEYDETGRIFDLKDDKIIQGVLVEFFSIIKGCPPEKLKFISMIDEIRKRIRATINTGKSRIIEIKERVKSYEDMKKRFRLKKEGRNVFADVIENEINVLKNTLGNFNEAMKLNDKVLEFLDDYEYNQKTQKIDDFLLGQFVFDTGTTSGV